MEDIRDAFPQAVMHLNTLPVAAELFEHDPRFEKVFVIDVRKKGQRCKSSLQWLRKVAEGHYDLLIDLQRSDHTRLLIAMLWLRGCQIRYRLGRLGGFPYTVQPIIRNPQAHAMKAMRSMLAAVGIKAVTPCPVLHVPVSLVKQTRQMLEQNGLAAQSFAVFMPGSQAAGWLKRWGAERYTALGGLLLQGGVGKIVVLGGHEEIEECAKIVAGINARFPDCAVNFDNLQLLQIVTVCEAASFIVANDTGIAHIAATANRPVLVLCGPTDPRRVKPLGPQVTALQAKNACINCYGKRCRLASYPVCMHSISPELVAGLLLEQKAQGVDIRLF